MLDLGYPALVRRQLALVDRIAQRASAAEIHLRLLTWRGVYAHDGGGLGRLERVHEAADRRVAARVASLADAVEDGHHLDALGKQLLDLAAVRLDARGRARWPRWRAQACRQVRRFRQWLASIEIAGLRRELRVLLDGHARQAEIVRDRTLAGART
jgi:hypothetical protein